MCFQLILGVLVVAGALALLAPGTAHAEGTVDLYDGYAGTYPRGLIEWRNNIYGNGDQVSGNEGGATGMAYRRTFFRVYAQAGELILMGSSAMYYDMTNYGSACSGMPDGPDYGDTAGDCRSDIVVWGPGDITDAQLAYEDLPAPDFSCRMNSTVTGGRGGLATNSYRGVLGTRTQELGGPATGSLPSSTTPLTSVYNPCRYTAPQTGIYWVAFFGVGGASRSTADPWASRPPADQDSQRSPDWVELAGGTIAAPEIRGQCRESGSCWGANVTYQLNGVSMMDITVRNSTNSVTYPGRANFDYLAQYTGNNTTFSDCNYNGVVDAGSYCSVDHWYCGGTGQPSCTRSEANSLLPSHDAYEDFYTLTSDGYLYLVSTNGLDYNGYMFYGNRVGFTYPDGEPLYHDTLSSVYGDNYCRWPQGGALTSPADSTLWFNPPDAAAKAALGVPAPVYPAIKSHSFVGTYGVWPGSAVPTSWFPNTDPDPDHVGGGTFSFAGTLSTAGAIAQVVLAPNPGTTLETCANANFDPGLATNRVLSVDMSTSEPIAWDGTDNVGTPFPVSNPVSPVNGGWGYCYKLTLHGGEWHFPLIDPENSPNGGPKVRFLPTSGDDADCPWPTCYWGFYDDRGYSTLGHGCTSNCTVGTVDEVLPGPDTSGLPQGTMAGEGQSILAAAAANTCTYWGCPTTWSTAADGYDTSLTWRAYGNDGGNYGNHYRYPYAWGDVKGLDVWTYWPSNEVLGQFYITDDTPTAVELLSFTATGTAEGVVLSWETASEVGSLGFTLYRAEAADGPRVQVTGDLIPAQNPGSPVGGAYRYEDAMLKPGQSYYYWLEDVDIYGRTRLYGPVEASLPGSAPKLQPVNEIDSGSAKE